MGKRKTTATVDIKLRMKEPLRRSIEVAAKKNGVSMNSEMVSRLEKTFPPTPAKADAVRWFPMDCAPLDGSMATVIMRMTDGDGICPWAAFKDGQWISLITKLPLPSEPYAWTFAPTPHPDAS